MRMRKQYCVWVIQWRESYPVWSMRHHPQPELTHIYLAEHFLFLPYLQLSAIACRCESRENLFTQSQSVQSFILFSWEDEYCFLSTVGWRLEEKPSADCWARLGAGSAAPLLTPPHSWPPCSVSSSFSCPQDTSFEMEEATSVWVRGVIKMQWHTRDFSDVSVYCVDSNHETITELREREAKHVRRLWGLRGIT